jgi:hypothetical protein
VLLPAGNGYCRSDVIARRTVIRSTGTPAARRVKVASAKAMGLAGAIDPVLIVWLGNAGSRPGTADAVTIGKIIALPGVNAS